MTKIIKKLLIEFQGESTVSCRIIEKNPSQRKIESTNSIDMPKRIGPT